jgi:hypothetical protein
LITVGVGAVVAAVAILAAINVFGNILAPSSPVAEAVAPVVEEEFLLVGNTGGEGAYVRRTPNLEDRLRAWPEGTRLRVLGPDTMVDGTLWKHVEDPAGNSGWIPADYTSPG